VGVLRSGVSALGLLLDVAGAAAWGLAAFFIVNHFVSTAAGGLLGLGIFFSMLSYMLSGRLQESRAKSLIDGACPRCRAWLHRDHEHRRWDTERERWLAPLTSWDCAACGYGHAEPVPCSNCPQAV
jgi:hypothetical protein